MGVSVAPNLQNTSLAGLVANINSALGQTSLSGEIQAVADGSEIELEDAGSNVAQFTIQIASPTNSAATQLGFATGQQSSADYEFSSIQEFFSLLAGVTGVSVNPQFNPSTRR